MVDLIQMDRPKTAAELYADEIEAKKKKSETEQKLRNKLAKEERIKSKLNPFTGQLAETKEIPIKRRSGDGPAYLKDINISPEASVDGIRFVATKTGKKAENLGVRRGEARIKRTTWQDGVK